MIKVGVVGAKGRMGQAVVEAVRDADDLALVAAVDIGVPPTALGQAGAEVIVDFTTPDAVMRTLRTCIGEGIHCVVGTTGFDEHKLEQVREMCRRNARPFEYAFLLDALKDEQAQGITIDTARCFFKTAKRRYILIDAPGHIEFLKNMIKIGRAHV